MKRKKAKSRSGDIAVLAKQSIFEDNSVLKGCSENIIWFNVKNLLFRELVLFGAVYIPPESSSYSSINLFNDLEEYIIIFPANYVYKIVSEYDQEIPKSQTADKPMAPRGRATQQSRDNRKTYKA